MACSLHHEPLPIPGKCITQRCAAYSASGAYRTRQSIAIAQTIDCPSNICWPTPRLACSGRVIYFHGYPPDGKIVETEIATFDEFWQCHTLDMGAPMRQSQ